MISDDPVFLHLNLVLPDEGVGFDEFAAKLFLERIDQRARPGLLQRPFRLRRRRRRRRFRPGGGGGGLGAAAFGSPAGGAGRRAGFVGSAAFSAGFSVCGLSFCSSATFYVSEGTGLLRRAAATQRRGFNHTLRSLSTPSSVPLPTVQQNIVTQRGIALPLGADGLADASEAGAQKAQNDTKHNGACALCSCLFR